MHPFSSVSSVSQSCLTLCDPMDCSMPDLPLHHQVLELAQTHVHRVGGALQPSHPLSSPSPPAFSLSQHQGFFQWVSSSHQVGQSIGVSTSASVLPMNIQDWFPWRLTGLISLQYKGLSRVFSNTTVQKHQLLSTQLSLCSALTSIHGYWKNVALTRQTFVGKVVSLLFNMLPSLVIAFLPRSKCLLISWLQSPSAVILEPPKIKSLTVSIVSPSICHEVMGLDAMILVFWVWVVSQLFHSPLSLSSRGSLVLLHFLP